MPAIEALGAFVPQTPATLNVYYIRKVLSPLLVSGDSIDPESLRLVSEAAAFALTAPKRRQNPGRPPNLHAQAVAKVVTKGYKDLTAREPTFTQSGPEPASGTFISFAREIFAALDIPHPDPLSFVARAARAVRGVGRKK